MSKRKIPEHKPSVDGLESVQVFRANLAALLDAAQKGEPPEKGLNQAEFAGLVGMSLRNLRNLLDGQHAATLRTIERAAKGLHMEPWMLLLKDLKAEFALSAEHRNQMQNVIRRYISATPRVRSAIEDLLPVPPNRPQ